MVFGHQEWFSSIIHAIGSDFRYDNWFLSSLQRNLLKEKMRLFLYGLIFSIGILCLSISSLFIYKEELFVGWVLPVFAGCITMYSVNRVSKKKPAELTLVLMKGFVLKFIYYGVAIFLMYKYYSFEPLPFICSFVSFFIVFHVLEAIVIKRVSNN